MILTIPMYVVQEQGVFGLRPLFGDHPTTRSRDLSRATSLMLVDLGRLLTELSKENRHDELARLSFAPDLEERQVNLTLFLRRHTLNLRLLLIAFRRLDRRIVFSPQLEDIWFAVERGQDLIERATEVYTEHFRALEHDDEPLDAEGISLNGKAWVTALDVDFAPRKVIKPPPAEGPGFFFLGGSTSELSGEHELHEVGRCLDWQYPNGLMRAFGRDIQVEELGRLLESRLKRPVVLVGPPKVGKTSLIHERTYRIAEARGGQHSRRRQTWLISPQRLIAGMSYVGQWEQRVLAILKQARKMRHILYFDDLLGLFQAGISAQSNLSVGQMIKPFIERREVSILAEITPQALGVLQEVDRGFADLFHLIRLTEPKGDEVLGVLIRQVRELEGRHDCVMHPAVLPLVIDLQRRYARQLAFPGKAAVFLEQIAVKFRGREVTAEVVLDEFHRKSGLALSFLSDAVKLERKEVIDALSEHVKGQAPAIEAMANVIAIGKARLQDPTRPLGSLLFLGPTGVGKTQSAKALACYLFGDERRMLRFDMNEYGDPGAVGRLVGTFYQPGGQLTTAVQQNPFAVVLLDEIEKAHPEVFNLLLQVLDDGRLTDALGRTADFTNAIVILTSNLGASEARSTLGFTGASVKDGTVYTKAAESFFRPEFFNRLDRIIPFAPLDAATIQEISRVAIQEVFRREGLRRRKCVLDVEPEALEAVAREGYRPLLGARALKRVIERRITRPVAARLAGISPENPTMVSVVSEADQGFAVRLAALQDAPEQPLWPGWLSRHEPSEAIERLEATMARIDLEVNPYRPEQVVGDGGLTRAQQLYFHVRELLTEVRQSLEVFADELDLRGPDHVRGITVRQPTKRMMGYYFSGHELDFKALFAAHDLEEYLREVTAAARPFGQGWRDNLVAQIQRLALAHALVRGGPERAQERGMLAFRVKGATVSSDLTKLEDMLRQSYTMNLPLGLLPQHGIELDEPGREDLLLTLTGPTASSMIAFEAGSHLFWRSDGSFSVVVAEAIPISPEESLGHAYRRWTEEQIGLAESVPPVIRTYLRGRTAIDLRTGLIVHLAGEMPAVDQHRPMLLSQLPLPPELED